MIRKPITILNTMKIDSSGELAIPFQEMKAVILEIVDLETKFGDSIKAVLENAEKEMKFNVFINNFSMKNLCDVYGEDDVAWIGKIVEIKKETDTTYNKDMIVLHPIETEEEPETEEETETEIDEEE